MATEWYTICVCAKFSLANSFAGLMTGSLCVREGCFRKDGGIIVNCGIRIHTQFTKTPAHDGGQSSPLVNLGLPPSGAKKVQPISRLIGAASFPPLSPSPPTKYWHQYRYIIVMEGTRYEDERSRVKSVTVPGPRYRIITLISHGIKVTAAICSWNRFCNT